MEEKVICSHCGELIVDENYGHINGEIICSECIDRYCTTCERCGALMWDSDSYGDDYTVLCRSCYENHYTRCYECDALIHNDDSYEYDGEYYCRECYDNVCCGDSIHDYNYKPEPVFYGNGKRYFGVELEIDIGGKDCAYADEILAIANDSDEHIYIKSDGSLNDGMEIVTHPMTLEYHKNFCWDDIMRKAVSLGYRSHQTSTCGLHVHVNRTAFSDNREEQDEIISRILYFIEHHWNELLKFSRRSEYTMNRWAARYGYEHTPKAIMDKAKKSCCGRYAAVNLCNYHTIEFRMFRGTLKYNTFIASIELVNRICDVAMYNTDDSIAKISWSDFVADITEPELIQYLKERNLYINEKVEESEEY